MRQQSTDLRSRRAKLKKSAYMLAAVFFCFVGVVFAWFNNSSETKIDTLTLAYSGEPWGMTTSYAVAVGIDTQSDDMEELLDGATRQSYDVEEQSDGAYIQAYDAEEQSDGTDIQSYDTDESSYETDMLSYYKSLDGEDAYQVISGGSGFSVTVNPGEGIFFMTTVSNSESTEKNISLYLTGTSYSKSLQGAVQIGVLKENSDGTTETAGIEVPDDLVKEKTEGDDTLCYLESVQLIKDVTIPAGDDTSPGTATIKWYIWLDGRKVENACQNAGLVIGQLQIVAEE